MFVRLAGASETKSSAYFLYDKCIEDFEVRLHTYLAQLFIIGRIWFHLGKLIQKTLTEP